MEAAPSDMDDGTRKSTRKRHVTLTGEQAREREKVATRESKQTADNAEKERKGKRKRGGKGKRTKK